MMTKKYFKFSIAIFFLVLFGSGVAGTLAYCGKHKAESEKVSFEIQRTIEEALQEFDNILNYMGKEISNFSPEDVSKIAEHLKLVKVETSSNSFWTHFIWINSDNWILASSLQGILKKPIYISQRKQLSECPKNPWKMILCPPDWGYTSNLWIIPIGMGITDEKNRFLGTLTGGININVINQKIQQNLNMTHMDFVILDASMNPVFHSPNWKKPELQALARDLFQKFNCFRKDRDFRYKPLGISDHYFFRFEKIKKHPYYVFIGTDKKLLKNDFYAAFFPVILEAGTLSLCCLLLLFLLWREKLQPMHAKNQELQEVRSKLEHTLDLFQNSEKEQDNFLKDLGQKLEYSLNEIISSAQILHKNLKGAFDFLLSPEQQMNFTTKIIEESETLKFLTANQLQLSEIDVQEMIQKSVRILSKIAFLKKIHLSLQIPAGLPKIFLDRFRFQQVVLGLLSRAIKYTPEGETVEIKALLKENALSLSIKDGGFGLGEEDIHRLEETFSNEPTNFLNPIALELSAIKKLIELHRGSIEITAKWGEGTHIDVAFPYHLEKKEAKIFIHGDLES